MVILIRITAQLQTNSTLNNQIANEYVRVKNRAPLGALFFVNSILNRLHRNRVGSCFGELLPS